MSANTLRTSAAKHGGIGVDVVDVLEVRRAIDQHGEAYVGRVFTEGEARFCRAAASPDATAHRFAAIFAAKEALLKALGWRDLATSLHGIEVAQGTGGAWRVNLHGPVQRAAEGAGWTHFQLSLAYAAGYATAVVTATRVRASHTE